ncbi:uncharacterized protein LOC135934961 [Cloeon dipterum]|uniref:uncharacterized protein LOC135934961 n=1 Tax=Cloeon dipterum TaxID=197152 RepID=UPI00321FA603
MRATFPSAIDEIHSENQSVPVRHLTMTPTERKLALVTVALVGFLLASATAGEVKVEKSKTQTGEQRGLLPTLGLLALFKLSRPLLFSGGFHSYGTFGSAGAYYHPHPQPFGYPYGGIGAIGAATGVAGYPPGYPHYPVGYAGPYGTTNIRGVHPTNAIPNNAVIDDLRKDQDNEATAKPGYFQYLQEAASPLLHAGQKVQSRSFQ